jgi:peptidoglycan/xylan/chitin deacetylase (PgdA/CDA1 family)
VTSAVTALEAEEPIFTWPDGVRAAASFTFDVDAESCVLAHDPAAATRMSLMSHQSYGPRVAVPKILRILARQDIRATFFVPGFTAECYPDTIRQIVADGHEVGWHGYLHELPHELPVAEQRAIIERAAEVLEPLTGARPVGYRAPWWQLSLESPELLASAGFRYDSSLMDDDVPYLLAADAGTLVELPVHWSFDDWEQYGFFVDPPLGDSLEPPGKLLEIWQGELEAFREEGCLQVLTMHPFLSGRPARSRTIGKFVTFARALGGVWFATAGEVAEHARSVLDESGARRLRSALDPGYGMRDSAT